MKENLTAIILAAGTGSRFSSDLPKAYVKLRGKPVLWYSSFIFNQMEEVEDFYIVISESMQDYCEKKIIPFLKPLSKFRGFIHGGKTRQESVFKALKFISVSKKDGYVAIHDSARPFVKAELIRRIFDSALKFNGASCGIPVVDTIKQINDLNIITGHLKRDEMTAIQTPQIFQFQTILKAYQTAFDKNIFCTDDTEVFSLTGGKSHLVDGDPDLFKITYRDDLKKAEILLKRIRYLWK